MFSVADSIAILRGHLRSNLETAVLKNAVKSTFKKVGNSYIMDDGMIELKLDAGCNLDIRYRVGEELLTVEDMVSQKCEECHALISKLDEVNMSVKSFILRKEIEMA